MTSSLATRAAEPESGAGESCADVARRVGSVVPTLREVLSAPLSASASSSTADAFVVTGVGGSEGPARLLVSALGHAGRVARFVPLSAFVAGSFSSAASRGRSREAVCVFSQGLSPNASVALERAASFHEAFLFTSLAERAPALSAFVGAGGRVISLPPAQESGSLLRIVGPAAAMLAAALFASAAPSVEPRSIADSLEVTAASARSLARSLAPLRLLAPLAFVTSGDNEALAEGLAIKWIEGLARPCPPTWDALAFAHGPFHAFYTEPLLLVAVGPPSPLFGRLGELLVSERHSLLHLETSLPFPYARLELEVAMNELFLAAFEASPRDLFTWPSKGKDGALYGIASALPEAIDR